MVDLDTFWKSLKISWFRRLLKSNSSWFNLLSSVIKEKGGISINELHFWGELRLKHLAKKLKNPFWSSVLVAGSELCKSIGYALPRKIGLFPLCNNPLFKINKNTIRNNIFGNNRNIQVSDLLCENSNIFCTLESFNNLFKTKIKLQTFNNIKKAITDGASALGIGIETAEIHCRPRQSIIGHVANSQLKGCRPFYNIFRCKKDEKIFHTEGERESRWQNDLQSVLSLQFGRDAKK